MKRLLGIFTVLAIVTALNGCTGSGEKEKKTEAAKKKSGCEWEMVRDSSSVNWTAFKTTAKKGVKGWFDDFTVSMPQGVDEPVEVLSGSSFSIRTKSINSGNDERDPKLVKYFFGTLAAGNEIKGTIISVDGNAETGTGVINMTFNDIAKNIDFDYVVSGDKVALKTTIQLAEWNAENARKALNEECKELHAGDDGVSKLWDEVDIEVIVKLNKNC